MMYAKIRKEKINKLPNYIKEDILYEIVRFASKGVHVLIPLDNKNEYKVFFIYYDIINVVKEDK